MEAIFAAINTTSYAVMKINGLEKFRLAGENFSVCKFV